MTPLVSLVIFLLLIGAFLYVIGRALRRGNAQWEKLGREFRDHEHD